MRPAARPAASLKIRRLRLLAVFQATIAGPLRMRVDLVVHRQIAVAVDHRAEHHARVLGEERLLKRRQRAIRPVQDPGAVLQRIGAGDLDIVFVEHVVDGDGAVGDGLLEHAGQRDAGFHGAGDEFGVLVVDRPQPVFDFFGKRSIRRLEPRPRARVRMLADANRQAPMLSRVA